MSKPKTPASVTPKIDYATMAANYGLALAFMNSNHELKALFDQAVKGSWQPEQFTAHLMNTKWFKSNSASVRNAILQKTSDPATYNANIAQMKATIQATWGSLWGTPLSDAQLTQQAIMAHDMGWNQDQITQHLGNATQWQQMMTSQGVGGKAGETMDSLRQLQQNYGVSYTEKWAANQAHNVLEGKDTLAAIEDRMRSQAAVQYPAFAAALQSGQTMKDVADPYIQQMGNLLEMDPNGITLNDPTIQKALKATTAEGKPAALSMNAFEQQVRTDPRWQYTDNAKQTMYDATSSLLKSFGLSAT